MHNSNRCKISPVDDKTDDRTETTEDWKQIIGDLIDVVNRNLSCDS